MIYNADYRPKLDEFLKIALGNMVIYTENLSHKCTPLQIAGWQITAMINAVELILYRVADDIDDYPECGENKNLLGRI